MFCNMLTKISKQKSPDMGSIVPKSEDKNIKYKKRPGQATPVRSHQLTYQHYT